MKKTLLALTIMGGILVAAPFAFASENPVPTMMEQMMGKENTAEMVKVMNTPQGKEMVKSCTSFMESYKNGNTR